MMTTISFTVVNLPLYKQKMNLQSTIELPYGHTFLDLIAGFDLHFWKEVLPTLSEKERARILLFNHCRSLLQVLWNPKSNTLYSDVLFQARPDFSSRELLPIFDDFDLALPTGADITVGPDQGC